MSDLITSMTECMGNMNRMVSNRGKEKHTIVAENGESVTKTQFTSTEWEAVVIGKAKEYFGSIEQFYEAYEDCVLQIFRDLHDVRLTDIEGQSHLRNAASVASRAEYVWINYLWSVTPPPSDNILQNRELISLLFDITEETLEKLHEICHNYRDDYANIQSMTQSPIVQVAI